MKMFQYFQYYWAAAEEAAPIDAMQNNNIASTSVFDNVTTSITPDLANANVSLATTIEKQLEKAGDESLNDEYIFDRTDVRVIFIALYTVVFCCCFFGNLLVILVVTLSRRLRSNTNFFLANLALADLCVGLFCVFQNLSLYLVPSWIFGDFLCKMYQFIHSLSYTASIFILVVICSERYFAIIHPITCKQILTPIRLRLVIVGVWITSALYSAPKFIWVQTITNDLGGGERETICINHRRKYDAELFDMINFGLLYVIPLCIMTVLYTIIAVGLWRSSRGIERRVVQNNMNLCSANNCTAHCTAATPADVQVSVDVSNNYSPLVTTWRPRAPHNCNHNHNHQQPQPQSQPPPDAHFSHLSQKVLRARRGVIRMLIVVVLTFAACNLPFHARKMWQHWSTAYDGGSAFSTLLTPLTFLVTYFNSGVNPFLYAFLSRNFRKGMRELLACACCRLGGGDKLLDRRDRRNRSALLRRSCSTRSNNRNNTATMHTNVTDT